MTHEVKVHPLFSPWGRFGLYSFFIDSPEPAIVDTGIASSPAEGMASALEALGRSIEEVRWVLLTHGHIDHLGGAHALSELTGGRAKVAIHEGDVHLLRSRRAHVDLYMDVRQQYLDNPHAEEEQTKMADAVISGEMEPDVLLKGGETLPLGGDVTVSVHPVPGHTAGSVAYVIDGQDGRLVWGRASSSVADTQEPLAWAIAGDNKTIFGADADGYYHISLITPDRIEKCYVQNGTGPSHAVVAACYTMDRVKP